jgi:hypothetical protein
MSVMTVATGAGSAADADEMPPEPVTVLAITAGSGAQFTFNNNNFTYDNAEMDCQMQGGHLASYDTMQEQQDVESFLIDNVRALGQISNCCAACKAPCLQPSLLSPNSCCHKCARAPLAGHPYRLVRLAWCLLDRTAGCAPVPQLYLGRPHRGEPGFDLRQLGRYPGRARRAP